jgi:hypothetical protein
MDTKTATAVLSRFLLPRVRAWITAKRDADDAVIDMRYLYPCSVCWEPAFASNWCHSCREHHAKDAVGFAKKHILCKHCFMPEGAEGCVDMCPESREEMWRLEDEMDWYDGAEYHHQRERKYGWDRD